jgi:glutathione S-transferase
MTLVLHGYKYSVYLRIARLVLVEKGAAYERVEVNPFAPDVPADYLRLNPFGRVPTLVHDGFVLYETSAITRYLDRAFPGPRLQPEDSRAAARMDQIIAVVDAYGYWPLVRQVFSHRVFRPRSGQPADDAEVAKGLAASAKVLEALESLMASTAFLTGEAISLADFHLAPCSPISPRHRRAWRCCPATGGSPAGGSASQPDPAWLRPIRGCRRTEKRAKHLLWRAPAPISIRLTRKTT